MKAAQDEARQIAPFTSEFSDFDIPAAYEVADMVHRQRVAKGAVPVGRKIGFTNPDMWSRYGVHEPVWGYVYDTTLVRTEGKRRTCSIGKLLEPLLEPEIVFHFRAAPPQDGSLASILACVDWIAHGFEIVHTHFPGWKFQAADTIADQVLHATLLVGEPRAVDQLGPDLIASLERFSVALSCDGKPREVGQGSNVLGSPLNAIAHLISVLDRQPKSMPLQANEWVTTGTITAAQAVHAGETWQTELKGIALPGLTIEFTP